MPFSSLVEAAVTILNTASTCEKARLTSKVAIQWKSGDITAILTGTNNEIPPLEPARPDSIRLVEPRLAPKRGKGGSLEWNLGGIEDIDGFCWII